MAIVTDFPLPRSNYRVKNNSFGKFNAPDFLVTDPSTDAQWVVHKTQVITFAGVRYLWSSDDNTVIRVDAGVPGPAPLPPVTPPVEGTSVYFRVSLTRFEGATKIML